MDRTRPGSAWARLGTAVGIGLLTAICSYPWWHEVSPWASIAFFVTGATIADLPQATLAMAPFPHFGILIATLQYGLAPLASYYYAPEEEYRIGNFARYFAYAGPAILALALGWIVSILGLRSGATAVPRRRSNPRLLLELDLLLWGGMAVSYFAEGFGGGGLAFLLVLLGGLRFVGAIGWMILAQPGWKWRVAVAVAYELMGANRSGMFHDFILWGLSLMGVYVFLRRFRGSVLLAWMAVLAAFVFFLQDAKWQIRQTTWGGEGAVTVFGQRVQMSPWTRPLVSVLCVADSASKLVVGGYSDESLDYSINRFNQGWIIDLVLQRVPDTVPYARGETVLRALEASLLPRFLAPNKLLAGGKDNMERFAGRTLGEETSMNLGFAGELYANFGYWGGIVGCGIYALVLGLLFRWVAVRAGTSPLWWAVAAYVGHWALKAESDVGSIMNYVTKGSVVVLALIFCMPALRAELRGVSGRKQKAESDPLKIRNRESRKQKSEGGGRRSEGGGQRSEVGGRRAF
ncbi:MAG: hypothetical protein WCK27_22980 [Verrucomicrobiota bacterium]